MLIPLLLLILFANLTFYLIVTLFFPLSDSFQSILGCNFPRKAIRNSSFYFLFFYHPFAQRPQRCADTVSVALVETCQGLMNGLLKSKQEPNLSATTWLCEANHTPSKTLVFMYFIALSDLEVEKQMFFYVKLRYYDYSSEQIHLVFFRKKTESIQKKTGTERGKKRAAVVFMA